MLADLLDEPTTIVREIDPVSDPEWLALIERHPRSSVFHTPGWLEALKRTYGYEPFALTASPRGQRLTGAVVFCRVSSWLTGRRLVSLPFSDHCEPLIETAEQLKNILASLCNETQANGWDYIEIRPFNGDSKIRDQTPSATFCSHTLDLRSSVEELFWGFHKNCVQRKIRRAAREHLDHEEGRSEAILDQFYRLLVITRKRYGLLPQPLAWFRNLIDCLKEKLQIRVALKNGQPVAGEDLDELAEDISREVDRAAGIINHLRQFGRKSGVVAHRVDINGSIRGVFTILGQQLKVYGIEVKLDLDENLPPIMADENRVEQVFVNLVNNARDAMLGRKAGGHDGSNVLTVRSFSQQGRVTATVSDTGPGIPESIRGRLFEPFFTTKETGKGTGLGLSISYGIVRDYKGTIDLTTDEGMGATFIVSFPEAPPE